MKKILWHLLITAAVAFCYGHIECKYIPTGLTPPLPGIFHIWSYYHLWMVALLTISSFSLAVSHSRRKNFIWLICTANAIASLMLEDIAWFITAGHTISRGEWTMIHPGWGVNLYFTWVPYWYFVVIATCVGLYWLALRELKEGVKF